MEGLDWTRSQLESLTATLDSPGWAMVERVLTGWKQTECDEVLGKATVSGEDLLRVSGVYRGLAMPFNLPVMVADALAELIEVESQILKYGKRMDQ
jgi:hypothetical protein